MSGAGEIRWARRVPQHKVRRLYALDAKGIVDEELIDDVGYAMYARCESIRTVTEAHAGRVACPRCASVMRHDWHIKDEVLTCECGWQAAWRDYLKSYQRKQLYGGNGYPAFLAFLETWPQARAPRDKLFAIDRLIHACHASARFGFGRTAAVNLIEGTASELLVFLNELAYGDGSTPGLSQTRDEWLRTVATLRWGRRGGAQKST